MEPRPGYAYLHQLIAEEIIGRRLADNETVHHIDGNVQNNAKANLIVMNRSDHAVIHAMAAKRNLLGQFVPGLKRTVREFPEARS